MYLPASHITDVPLPHTTVVANSPGSQQVPFTPVASYGCGGPSSAGLLVTPGTLPGQVGLQTQCVWPPASLPIFGRWHGAQSNPM
mmetsp:Transcript_9000/g.15641  ORF Transcript_9000/g.15641 Transcript_9000/m.15641 type:complete len:85 (+) Transcript_9000:614-868(+)